jgi:hypothetical protein
MGSRNDAAFGFRIRPTGAGWVWTTFDLAGRVQERGHAPDKTLAAACVIRSLARAAQPAATSGT